MIRIKYVSLIAALLIGLCYLSSCTPKTIRCTLTTVSTNNGILQKYFMVDGKLMVAEQYDPGNGFMVVQYLLSYDDLGRLDYVDITYPDGSLWFRRKCNYNSSGKLSQIYLFTDSNNDHIPETFGGYFAFTYNSDNKIAAMSTYNASLVFVGSDYYTWVGDNLTREDAGAGTPYELYTYDDKKAVYGNLKDPIFVCYMFPSFLSANNVTNHEYYDAVGGLITSVTYNYAYDGNEYPVSESVNGYSYEYSCIEE